MYHPLKYLGTRIHRLPRDSSIHRIACIALYRALLKQSTQITLPADYPIRGPIHPVKHLVRKGFKRHVDVPSPRLAVEALKVGYRAETLLRTAISGSEAALTQIHNLLSHLTSKRLTSQANPTPPRPSPPRVWPLPGIPKILDSRPLPLEKLSGKRKVPVLSVHDGFPFMRLRKPQSSFLGRVLRDKHWRRHKRWVRIWDIEHKGEIGEAEEEWEALVKRRLRLEASSESDDKGEGGWALGGERTLGEEGEEKVGDYRRFGLEWDWGKILSWRYSMNEARREIYDKMFADSAKARELGRRMGEIVDRERELWEKEREERKMKGWQKRLERRTKMHSESIEKVGISVESVDNGPQT